MAIDFDYYSDEISWVLQDSCSGEQLLESRYDFGETSDFLHVCIPRSQYVFELSDSYGDGLGLPPPGNVTVNYDGGVYELDTGGDFGYYTNATFGYATCSPTMAPTALLCNDDEATFEVAIDFDYYSHEISWVLQDSCSGEQLLENQYAFGKTSDFLHVCIPRSQYVFELSDSFGDGLGFPHPGGNVTVNYDGGDYELDIGGDFGSSAKSFFGDNNITCSPTMAPTALLCNDDEATFEVAIDFDYYSDDVSWNLLSMCTSENLFEKVYSSDVTSDFLHVCIPRGRYVFELSDSFGDGLGHPFWNLPDGNVTVNYDGDDYELVVEGDFGYFATAVFGNASEASCVGEPIKPPKTKKGKKANGSKTPKKKAKKTKTKIPPNPPKNSKAPTNPPKNSKAPKVSKKTPKV